MNSTINRFMENTIRQFIRKEYTAEEVIKKLRSEIGMLSDYLMKHEPDTKTWRDKATLLKEKKAELESFLNANTQPV